jgi:hypothetical protein
MNINLFKSVKYGVILGVGFCLYTVLMWLTKLDSTYLSIGQYFDMAIILLPLSIISLGIYQQNKFKCISLLQRISIAVLIGMVSFIIYDPFLYFYHNVINPDWFSSVLTLKELELSEANVSPNLIAEQLQRMKGSPMANPGIFQLSSIIASVIVIPFLISLISLLFIKNTK